MADHSSKSVILWAAGANTGIGIAKFFGAWLTGSAAMLSEGIHSMVDVSNQLLLLVGLRIAAKPPSETRPSGYGRAAYVFGLLVAQILFGLGAIYTGYESIHKISHPGEIAPFRETMIAIGILIFGIGLEGKSWWVAYQAFRQDHRNTSIIQGLINLRDPAVLVILLEDTAAMLGLLFALVGISLAYVTGNPAFDAWASMSIAVLLGVVAIFLFIECMSMIMGEPAAPELVEEIRSLVLGMPKVNHINQLVTEYIGPKELRVLISIDVDEDIDGGHVETLTTAMEKQLKQISDITDVWIEAQKRKSSDLDQALELEAHKERY